MNFKNRIMLITYPDSLGKNIKDLHFVLEKYFKGAVGGVHILPFFPSSEDRGFAPVSYDTVDERFGDWHDVEALSENYYLMYDFMVNHISRSSPYFKDFVEKKEKSRYSDMFITFKKFWPGGEPSQEDMDRIYKRKPKPPYTEVKFNDGSMEKIWCTFSNEQIDLNIKSNVTKSFIKNTILSLIGHKAAIIRLDAFAFTVKKAGTNCFFVEPEIWELLNKAQGIADPGQSGERFVLPEIHEHYSIQLKLAEKGFWVYDFALPMMLLHAIYLKNSAPLKHWLNICPRKQFTTLDTHDGIGIVDVKDLLSDEEIEKTKEKLFSNGANVKKIYNTVLYNNLDVYQINCTYYSALGDNDDAYLLARAVQFFAPGVPQVYYVGLLAGKNDIELMERTKVGRDINRHAYTLEEIDAETKRPVVRKLLKMMKFRNEYEAFSGNCIVSDSPDDMLEIHRVLNESETVLIADLESLKFSITYKDRGGVWHGLDLA